MTTYAYSLVFGDTEAIVLGAALDLLIEHCDTELDRTPNKPPFSTWRMTAENLKGRLHAKATQKSGNYTDPESGEHRIWIVNPPSDPSTKA